MRRVEPPPWIVSDDLWAEVEPLLPPRPPRRHRFPGRKPLDDRKVLCAILFVLYTAIPWAPGAARRAGCLLRMDERSQSQTLWRTACCRTGGLGRNHPAKWR
ncbi:transposase [Micromonospora sp. D93]|uniref:transposase n=1 Tax=Micromonospora sp. D93 TaxID=2824886 RepID=UPI001B38C913|nr:transposase [Micromonospora sp. D93]